MMLNGVKLGGVIHLAINLVIALFIIILIVIIGSWLKKLLLLALNDASEKEYEEMRRQELKGGDRHKRKRKIDGVTIPNDPNGELGKFVQKSEFRYFNFLFSLGIWLAGIVIIIQVALPGIADLIEGETIEGKLEKEGSVYVVKGEEVLDKFYTDPIYRIAIRDISEKVDDPEIYYTMEDIDSTDHIYDLLLGKEVKVYKYTGVLIDDNSNVKELQKEKRDKEKIENLKDKFLGEIEKGLGIPKDDIEKYIDDLDEEDLDKILDGEIPEEHKDKLEKSITDFLGDKMNLDNLE